METLVLILVQQAALDKSRPLIGEEAAAVHRKTESENSPRLTAWIEGSTPVDTTTDSWKDTTLQLGADSLRITKLNGIANINTSSTLGVLNAISPAFGVVGITIDEYAGVVGLGDANNSIGALGYIRDDNSYSIGLMGRVPGGSSRDSSNFAVLGAATGTDAQYSIGVVGLRVSGDFYTLRLNSGVSGYSDVNVGVYGRSDSPNANSTASGVYGIGFYGVYGISTDPTYSWGLATPNSLLVGDDALIGDTLAARAIVLRGQSLTNYIPHPNKSGIVVPQYSMESNEALSVYRGTVVLNPQGEATVYLPDYVESIGTDFSYQLTPIGAPMPNLYVKQEVSGNTFVIAGGEPGMKVSWAVYAKKKGSHTAREMAADQIELLRKAREAKERALNGDLIQEEIQSSTTRFEKRRLDSK